MCTAMDLCLCCQVLELCSHLNGFWKESLFVSSLSTFIHEYLVFVHSLDINVLKEAVCLVNGLIHLGIKTHLRLDNLTLALRTCLGWVCRRVKNLLGDTVLLEGSVGAWQD